MNYPYLADMCAAVTLVAVAAFATWAIVYDNRHLGALARRMTLPQPATGGWTVSHRTPALARAPSAGLAGNTSLIGQEAPSEPIEQIIVER